MDDREFYLARRKAEWPAFQRVFGALPKDKLDYKPHERSPSAAQIMWTLASEHSACVDLVDSGRIDWAVTAPRGYDEMLRTFELNWKSLDEKAARLDDAGWKRKGQFAMGGKVVNEMPVGEFLWFILFDAVHHRGQLSTYIRPMGGKVPPIYGPSGDSR
jgi:uncharacterized damage-inducible protein DinB